MIKFTEKIKQDFLPIEWVKRLQDADIELVDSKYFIIQRDGEEYIEIKENLPSGDESISITPTYTLPEILYKLPEYVDDNFGALEFWKDAPFYGWCFKNDKDSQNIYSEYPLYSAAFLLIYCAKNKKLWYVKDISDK